MHDALHHARWEPPDVLFVETKTELPPHLPGCSLEAIRENVARVMPEAACLEVSATRGEGVEAWIAWLERRRAREARRGAAASHTLRRAGAVA